MQKHNKYLIVTIWIATIAFIGAGFVGWGSYQYGSKASAIGKVGEVEISQEKFDMTYRNLYNQYNEMFKGQFDEAKAKEMGLLRQTFNALASQAQLLNLAKQYGIVVSDKELGEYILSIKAFQKDGVFNKSIYENYLKSRGLKAKTFESVLKDELTVKKLMSLIETKPVDFEKQVVASALSIADKLAYKVLSPEDIQVSPTEEELKAYWEQFKDQYMTPRAYKLEILWTDSAGTEVTEQELRDYYDKNSYNYVGADGKQFTFDQAKAIVTQDYKLKKTKKEALKAYVAFKKGEKSASETKQLNENDPALSAELWQAVSQADTGEVLKPKVVGNRYATVKIVTVVEPKVKSFAEAKAAVAKAVAAQKRSEMLEKRAKETLNQIEQASLTTTDWMSMRTFKAMAPLSKQETLQFLQKLFTSSAKNGMITVSDSVVVYKIVEQKMDTVDNNLTKGIENDVNKIKRDVFEANLFKRLNQQYPPQKYVKGI